MTIALSYNNDLSRVQINLSNLSHDGSVRVERSTNELFWETVRGGVALPIDEGSGALNDYEFVDSVENFYRVVSDDPPPGLTVPGTSGAYASTPDHSSLDIASEIDIKIHFVLDNNTPGDVTRYLVTKYDFNADQRSYALRINSAGTIQVLLSTNGTGFTSASSNTQLSSLVANGEPIAIRATINTNDVTGAYIVTFYRSETIEGPWVQFGNQATGTMGGGGTTLFNSSAPLAIGAAGDGAGALGPGTVFAAEVRAGINGTVVANPRFDQQTHGAPSFDDGGNGAVLNSNSDFETDLTGWTNWPPECTVVHSTEQAHSGTGSAKITPDGVQSFAGVNADVGNKIAVTPGQVVYERAWVFSPTGYNQVRLQIDWEDSGGSYLSTSTGTITDLDVDTWTPLADTFTAPASAAFGVARCGEEGTPAASDVLYVDELEVRFLNGKLWTVNGDAEIIGSDVIEEDSITPSLGGQIWLKSIRFPFLNRPITLLDRGQAVGRESRSGVFPVAGRSNPTGVHDVTGGHTFTHFIKTVADGVDTTHLEEARDLDLVLASGDVFFIHIPQGNRAPGGYVTISSSNQERLFYGSDKSPHVFEINCTVVNPPSPSVVGSTLTWGTVLNIYGNWNALINANPTWADLVDNVGSPDDLVVL